ncbi:MAG: ferredoxin family protein [Planctomycetes bacterium]|nr:ferredoxin family protein [Planctomycetota bacterium]
MAYVITRRCVGVCDTRCVDACPVECISGPAPPEALRGGKVSGAQLFVDPDGCIDCNACLPVCPAGAIFPEHELPLAYAEDAARNASFFRPDAA